MSYPGNPSLSAEVQRRILGTFNQSLDLAAGGRRQEASLGCDFILQLDPSFAAATVLRDRLARGEGSVEVEDLRGGQVPVAPSFATVQMQIPPLGPPVAAELEEMLERRDFGAVLSRLQATPALLQQPGVVEIAQRAQDRFEAQPYVDRYLTAARQALATGSGDEVLLLVDKARALDPSHPQLDELVRAVPGAGLQDRELPNSVEGLAPEPVEDYELEIPEEDWNLEVGSTESIGLAPLEDEVGSFAPLAPPKGASFDFSSLDALPPLMAPPSFGDPPPAAAPAAPAFPSFSAPAPAFAAPEASPFGDLNLGGSSTPPGDERITALLEEGQNAQARGDLQAAIDAWSRIFLIDVDHAEAAQRIEGARRQKAEQERQVEEVFHEGLGELERGNTEAARARFDRVLTLQPGHLAAREALERLDSGGRSVVGLDSGFGAGGDIGLDPLAGFGSSAADLREEILVPPPPGASSSGASTIDGGKGGANLDSFRMVAVKKETPKRTFALVGGAVFLLVLSAGWLLARNWSKIFPNSNDDEVAVVKVDPGDPVEHAEKLYKEGKAENALAFLKRVRPDHPRFAAAQALISTWEQAAEKQSAEASDDVIDQQQGRFLAAARTAERESERLLASLLYERAAKVAPLSPEDQAQADAIAEVLRPLKGEILLYREREYDQLLPRLWRRRESDPSNRDVQRMLVDCYYNLGVKALQQNDPRRALGQFDQVLELTANEPEVQRLRRFAEVYGSRSPDLLYRTFVKYVPQR